MLVKCKCIHWLFKSNKCIFGLSASYFIPRSHGHERYARNEETKEMNTKGTMRLLYHDLFYYLLYNNVTSGFLYTCKFIFGISGLTKLLCDTCCLAFYRTYDIQLCLIM